METLLNNLDLMAKEIKDSLTEFMLKYSEIESRKPYDEVWFIDPEGDRYYADMSSTGVKKQSALSKSYNEFFSKLQSLLENQPEDVLTKISKSNVVITRTIDHRLTWCDNTQHALNLALAAFNDQLKFLKDIREEKITKN